MPPPSRKRTHPGELSTKHMSDCLEAILPANVPILTNGALEGLRRLHEGFLQRVSAELGKSKSTGVVQPQEVMELLERMGYADLAKEAMTKMDEAGAAIRPSADTKGRATKKKKSPKWSTDMEAEQERLLAKSRQTMVGNKPDPS
jgi:hypothetical protein